MERQRPIQCEQKARRRSSSVPAECEAERWDVLVIGAGVAGAVAAGLAAQRGQHTLLVDAAEFPRDKVCGGCLSAGAWAILHQIGLGAAIEQLTAPRIEQAIIQARGRRASLPLPPGRAVSRRGLDAALASWAVGRGCEFRDGTRASVQPSAGAATRAVQLTAKDGRRRLVAARLVLVADGLGHPSLSGLPDMLVRTRRQSLVGMGTGLEAGLPLPIPSGSVWLAAGRGGYVGCVRLGDGSWTIAAAVQPGAVQPGAIRPGGSASTSRSAPNGALGEVAEILHAAGLDIGLVERILGAEWRGTRRLTCQAVSPAAERLLLLGDAAGYVEPFTGQGMQWALAAAVACQPLLDQALSSDSWDAELERHWTGYHERVRRREHRRCRQVAWLLRHPRLTGLAVGLLGSWPQLAAPFVRNLNRVPGSWGVVQ